MNSLVREIDALRTVVVWYAAILFSVCAAFLVLTPEILGYSGSSASSSLATNLFLEMKDMLIPETVSVVTLGPVAPFVAPIVVAFLVAIFATFPIGLFLLARFLSPALLPAERR